MASATWLDIGRLASVLARYPSAVAAKPFSYGTAGFRTEGALLVPVAARVALLVPLRAAASSQQQQRTQTQEKGLLSVGVVVTASHNPAKDNGLKIVDTNGGMLAVSWEQYATALANAPSAEDVAAILSRIVEEQRIDLAAVAAAMSANGASIVVHVARDTRETGPPIVAAVKEAMGALLLPVEVVDHGVMSTPQLHTMVSMHNNRKGEGRVCEAHYFDAMMAALETFAPALRQRQCGKEARTIVVDCSNGVGALKLRELQRRLACADSLKGLLNFDLRYTNTEDPTVLNSKCGADFTQRGKQPPADFPSPPDSSSDLVLEGSSSFYSIDGDADRVVSFAADGGRWHLLDGDRIAILFAMLIGHLTVQLQGQSGGGAFEVGVVQTAYANGASTAHVSKRLGLKSVLAATGVKHLHKKAEELFDIGVYFEANGHGTVLFSPKVLAHLKQIVAERDEGAGVEAARKLLSLSVLCSQCCGDAVGDMLAVEVALAELSLSPRSGWLRMYSDLPSRQVIVTVPDPTVITTTEDQTKALTPAGLQRAVDDAVAAAGEGGRAFVRPSGTEPIVRVYAEAATELAMATLADAVVAAVKTHCQ